MQGSWGWETREETHLSGKSNYNWQGQWEANLSNRSPHWESGNWDGWNTNGSLLNNEFENIMTWDDSGALEAYHIANERHEALSRGLKYHLPVPGPDLYIQSIDWDSHESVESLDSPEILLETEGNGQRKRGRRGFKGDKRGNKQFIKQDRDESSDWRQKNRLANERAQLQALNGWGRDIHKGLSKVETSRQEMYHAVHNAERQVWNSERYNGALDLTLMERPTYCGHTDRLKNPQELQWRHQKSFDPQNRYNHRWQQPNISGDILRGWSSPQIKGLHESPQGVNSRNHSQADWASSGNEWVRQQEPNDRVLEHYSQSSGGQRPLHPAPIKGFHESPQGFNSHNHSQADWASSVNGWVRQHESNDQVLKSYGQSSGGQRHLHPSLGPR